MQEKADHFMYICGILRQEGNKTECGAIEIK